MERFAEASEMRKLLAEQGDGAGKSTTEGGMDVPAQRGPEPTKVSDADVHRARLAVARGAKSAEDCRLLLEMLGLVADGQGATPVGD